MSSHSPAVCPLTPSSSWVLLPGETLVLSSSLKSHQCELWDDTHVGIQWNLSYLDTVGAEESVLISEVSLLRSQGYIHKLCLRQSHVSCLSKCPHFGGVLNKGILYAQTCLCSELTVPKSPFYEYSRSIWTEKSMTCVMYVEGDSLILSYAQWGCVHVLDFLD